MTFQGFMHMIAQAGPTGPGGQMHQIAPWAIPESMTAVLYALLGAGVILIKRKGDATLAQQEAEGADTLEARKAGRGHQITREQDIQRRLEAKEAAMDELYKGHIATLTAQLAAANLQISELSKKVLKEVEESARATARAEHFEAEANRLRGQADHYRDIADTAQLVLKESGKPLFAQQFADEISEADEARSTPKGPLK